MTLARPARFLLEVKKSRFLAQAAPVADADAALEVLHAVEDRAATHNCWAYRIGALYRSSDDNEPAGTAGRPILQAIDAQGVDHAMVVVTRWYGGIKLGAGGLARAYGGSAAECLRLADKIEIVTLQRLRVVCAFDDLGASHALMDQFGMRKLEETFTPDGVVLTMEAAADALPAFERALRDATRGRALATSA